MTPVSNRPPAQQVITETVELVVAPAAIERALHLYEQLQPHDTSVILQARKILTQHIFGMVDQGELDEQKLIVGGLAHLKAVERDHGIKLLLDSLMDLRLHDVVAKPTDFLPKLK